MNGGRRCRRAEFVLELHHQLDGVERVGVEVGLEVRLALDVRLLGAHLLADDVDHITFDLGLGHGWLQRGGMGPRVIVFPPAGGGSKYSDSVPKVKEPDQSPY